MRLFFFFVGAVLMSGCSGWVTPLVSEIASSSSEQFFTSQQKGDILELLDDILHAESCGELRNAIDYNPTIQEIEETYRLKEGFLHDELFYFFSLQNWTHASQGNHLVRGIVTAWLSKTDLTTVRIAINRVQKCHPRNYI